MLCFNKKFSDLLHFDYFFYADICLYLYLSLGCFFDSLTCDAIIDKLNAEGHIPCRGGQFTKGILTKLKVRYGIVSKLEQVRRGLRPKTAYSAEEIAAQIPEERS